MVKATRTKTDAAKNGTTPKIPRASDPDFTLLQLQSQLENDEGADRIVSLRTIGKLLMQKRSYADAASVYEALLAIDPTNVQTQETLARCLERLGRWSEAVARYQLALDADPDRPDALVGMGLSLLRQDAPPAALKAFERCLHLDPRHVGALLGKATCLRLTGKLANAEAAYREAVQVQPEIEAALDEFMGADPATPAMAKRPAAFDLAELENIIAAAVSAEDYVTAAEHCRMLTELAPDYYEAWFNLGVFEQLNSNFAAATEAFRGAVRQQPLSVEPLEALACSYHLLGDLKAAEAGYQAALALTPEAPDLMWNLALVLERRGEWPGAIQKYSHLVKADQDRGEAWFRLGFARLHVADYEGAVVAFRRAVDLGANTFEAHYNLALAYWELGRSSLSTDCFRTALKLKPNFAPAQRGLAAAALRESDYSCARDLLRDLVERGDASVEIIFNLAVLEHRANRLHSAIEFYQQALKIDPDLGDASAGLALAQGTLSARRYK